MPPTTTKATSTSSSLILNLLGLEGGVAGSSVTLRSSLKTEALEALSKFLRSFYASHSPQELVDAHAEILASVPGSDGLDSLKLALSQYSPNVVVTICAVLLGRKQSISQGSIFTEGNETLFTVDQVLRLVEFELSSRAFTETTLRPVEEYDEYDRYLDDARRRGGGPIPRLSHFVSSGYYGGGQAQEYGLCQPWPPNKLDARIQTS